MPRAVGDFEDADPGSDDYYTFDFVNNLAPGDSLIAANVTWEIATLKGVDPGTSQDYLLAGPFVFGTRVTIKGGGFLPSVQYKMQAFTGLTAFGNDRDLWATVTGAKVGC